MTDMDYKERYEKALDDMRAIYPNLKGDAKLAVEHAFPELTESEDERIRKWLIHEIEAIYVTDGIVKNENADKALAWLEKQKENPKSADSIPSNCTSDAKCEDRSPKHTDSFGTDIRDTPAYWRGWDDAMKQKEQKHPNGCFTCDEYKKGYESGRSNGFTAGYNKAMKEIDQKEQKPAEWSEEDEEIVNNIVSALGQYIDYKVVSDTGSVYATPRYAKEIAWLKSLRPSWKPSKDEERLINTSISFLKDFADKGYENAVECIDWLKSKLNGDSCK